MDYFPLAIVFGAIVVAYWLYEVEYKRYRLDRLRHDLYEIREQLFEKAAAGEISFDSRAYQLLRTNLNGLIRFSHDLSFVRVILMDRERRLPAGRARVAAYRDLLRGSHDELTDSQRQIFSSIQRQIHEKVFFYVGFSSVLGILFFGTVGTACFLYNLFSEIKRVGLSAKASLGAGALAELRPIQRRFELIDKEANRLGCPA